MANNEQLMVLLQGSEAWNKWRAEDSDAQIDLREADLREVNLCGANLVAADFREANLIGAALRGTDLREANLCGANLVAADFREATSGQPFVEQIRGIYFWHVEKENGRLDSSSPRSSAFSKCIRRLDGRQDLY